MKLIKFDLPINGIKVTTLDELRDNITDELLTLARSGQLERWLKTRQLPETAQAVAAAVATQSNDKRLFLALCAALEVHVHEEDAAALFDQPPEAGRRPGDSIYKELYELLYESLEEERERLELELGALKKKKPSQSGVVKKISPVIATASTDLSPSIAWPFVTGDRPSTPRSPARKIASRTSK